MMQSSRRPISITCPFCKGKKMFHPGDTVDPLKLSGSPVVCYLCRGRGTIRSRSQQMRDVSEAIKAIEERQQIKRDLENFHAQNRQ
jgi:hypothetical protein